MTREWTPERADAVAGRLGLRLGPDHWRVIAGARELSVAAGGPLDLQHLAAHVAMSTQALFALFPAPVPETLAAISGVGLGASVSRRRVT
ncbi:MAG: hypothetical protein HYV09_01190 [Deltaproteobacteria bacterium]|nr:hypothetical protein [Deltaproteobacteria bacterium]